MTRQIILDTETTGLSWNEGHRLIEIGCLEMINRRMTGKSFHCHLNPERLVDKEAFAVHGLSNEFLKDKPLFKDIAEEWFTFIRGAELIIHNAPFDIGFLSYELRKLEKKYPLLESHCTVLDTLKLARKKHPGQSNSLDALCRRYEIDNAHRELHGALMDAKLLAQVYLAMTGGQEQLFTDVQASLSENTNLLKNFSDTNTHIALTTWQLTPEELAAHHQFLEDLKKKGHCLWAPSSGDHIITHK